jgi:hypothetical protein
MNKICNGIQYRKTANDKIYTPAPVALKMIEMCNIKPTDKVLDCSKGAGIFYNNFPKCQKFWCEIDEEVVGDDKRDFFEFKEKVDWIIGNPPYSLWDAWLEHTMKITDKFCYIMGILNFTNKRIQKLFDNNYGITKISLVEINWWFGRHFMVVFEKNQPSILTTAFKNIVCCDICNSSKCKRGKKGNSFNLCTIIK